MKISHLWSITACFNPRSLSENSKWCSKLFHQCGTNHMLPFILDFLLLFRSGPADKSNIETRNCPGFFVCYVLDMDFNWASRGLLFMSFYSLLRMDFSVAAMQKPVNHVLVFICLLQTQQHKFTAKSACLHMFWLWLCHKNKLSVYHLFVCAC